MFGVLGFLLVFAGMDYMEKQKAQNTYAAWQDALQENTEDGHELYPDDLKPLTQGSPEMTSEEIDSGTLQTYVWSGMFRDYKILVYLDYGVKPAIAEIVPPNEADENVSKAMPPLQYDESAKPLAATDSEAKRNAEATYEAWQEKKDAPDGGKLQRQDLKSLVKGSPDLTETEKKEDDGTIQIYVWHGEKHDYKVEVHWSADAEPVVTKIAPPSEVARAAN